MKYLILFFIANSLALSVNCQLVINEFMASNSTTLADNTGEYDDWIEIYNAGNESLDLGQYYLTDDLSNPSKFDLQELPDIPAHGYLIIFADEDGSQGYDHANFKLDREGEVLAIVRISGSDTAFVDSLSYGSQLTDISYGRYPDASSNLEYFTQPTPGSSNISDNYLGIAPPADFSITGGFYQGTQHVELSTSLTDSEIRYTLDGSAPDDNDPLYTEPLFMDKTALLKARVFADDYLPGPTTGHSYFIDEHFIDFDIADRMSVVSVSPILSFSNPTGQPLLTSRPASNYSETVPAGWRRNHLLLLPGMNTVQTVLPTRFLTIFRLMNINLSFYGTEVTTGRKPISAMPFARS